MCEGGGLGGREVGKCTERTLSVRAAAEDPLSDISSRACAIEVASTADVMTQQGKAKLYVCALKEIKV